MGTSSSSPSCEDLDASSPSSVPSPNVFSALPFPSADHFAQQGKDKKRKVAALSTLRKRLIKKRRASKTFDHIQLFHEFLSQWSVRDVIALVQEYEATAALKELVIQATIARPAAKTCKQDLSDLYDYKYCTDTTLIYHSTSFPVHRAILSVRCPFFRELLDGPSAVNSQFAVAIDIPGVSMDMFNRLLCYLYTGDLNIAETYDGGLDSLIHLSEQFGIPNPLDQDFRFLLETGFLSDACLMFSSVDSRQHGDAPRGYVYDGVIKKGKSLRGDNEFRCHKSILAARSPFFRNVIQRQQRRSAEVHEDNVMRIVLDESVIPRRFAKIILYALYQDSVNVASLLASPNKGYSYEALHGTVPNIVQKSLTEEAMELYEVAKLLEMDALVQSCEDAIVDMLSVDTLVCVLRWSEQPHGSRWVYHQAIAYLREEFNSIAASPTLYQLDKSHLLPVVKSDFLQANELEILQAVLKWGETQLVKRMEEREPNVVSQTAHSVSRKGLRRRELSDMELREVLSELLCHIRIDHILPPEHEVLVDAIKRGLVRTPPSYMLGDDSTDDKGTASRGGAWVRGKSGGLFVRPRLLMPYVQEAKAWLQEHWGPEKDVGLQQMWHISHMPDTLYMVEKTPMYSEGCLSCSRLCHTSEAEVPEGTIPVPDEVVLRQMKKREQELRQMQNARRAYSLVTNSCDVTKQIQLRVVREFGLPDCTVEVLHHITYLYDDPSGGDEFSSGKTVSATKPPALRRSHPLDLPDLRPSLQNPLEPKDVACEGLMKPGEVPRCLQESHLSEMIPDIAMASALMSQLHLAESVKDDDGSSGMSSVHMF